MALDLSFDGIRNALSGPVRGTPGSVLLSVIGGGSDIKGEFEAVKAQVVELRAKVEALLAELSALGRQIQWVRAGLEAHPGVMRIWAQYEVLTSLAVRDTKTADRLKDAILDLNQGVAVDLLTLHRVIMGESSLDPDQSPLIAQWIDRAKGVLRDHARLDDSIRRYFGMLALLQFKGVILQVNAHLAYAEERDAKLAMGWAQGRLNLQAALLGQLWP